MQTIRSIMVAVDLSDYSLTSVQYAHALAAKLGADIMLVNVYNERDVRTIHTTLESYDAKLCDRLIQENMDWRRNSLAKMIESAGAQKTVTQSIVRVGVPYQALMAVIEQERPDLLVMGTKGRSNFADAVVGSCARKMFRKSPIPVLMLPPVAGR